MIAIGLVALIGIPNNNSKIKNASYNRRNIAERKKISTDKSEGYRRQKRDAELVTQWGQDPVHQIWGEVDDQCPGIPTDKKCKYPVVNGEDYKTLEDLVAVCNPSSDILSIEEQNWWNDTDKPIHELPDSIKDNTTLIIAGCIFGTLWLFVAVAIICDDFFVPSLEAISEKLDLSEDVAGATFMAAGSSAPELFTSLAAATSESDVGVGTIVGSAVFNLLVIVALSSALSGKILNLDWRPLARDSTFYTFSIVVLIVFAWDGLVEWWEALILVLLYFTYVGTMVFNERLMNFLVKVEESFNKCRKKSVDDASVTRPSQRDSHRFTHTEKKEKNNSVIVSKLSLIINGRIEGVNVTHQGSKSSLPEEHVSASASKASSKAVSEPGKEESVESTESAEKMNITPCFAEGFSLKIGLLPPKREREGITGTFLLIFNWILFVLSLPIYIIYTITIPRCDTPERRKWYLVSFFSAILWIVAISFGMLECVELMGEILGINHFTMGLVVIAVGTSIPDALSSILVARDGFGDMAVSNAIGSNVFDINLGLGAPFLIYTAIKKVPVSLLSMKQWCVYNSLTPTNSNLSILPHVKFGFVLIIILTITLILFKNCKFQLEKKTGAGLFSLYVIFLAYAFTQELICNSYNC